MQTNTLSTHMSASNSDTSRCQLSALRSGSALAESTQLRRRRCRRRKASPSLMLLLLMLLLRRESNTGQRALKRHAATTATGDLCERRRTGRSGPRRRWREPGSASKRHRRWLRRPTAREVRLRLMIRRRRTACSETGTAARSRGSEARQTRPRTGTERTRVASRAAAC